MKKWRITLIGAIVSFVAVISIFLWALSLKVVASYITAAGYIMIYSPILTTLLAMALFVGLGGGFLICTLLIYNLEKKLEPQKS